jgi:hypothetical protein
MLGVARHLGRIKVLILVLFIVGTCIFMLGGGIYSITVEIVPYEFWGGRILVICPYKGHQYLVESVLSTIILVIAILGFYLLYWGQRYYSRPKEFQIILLVGICMILIACLGLYWLFSLKPWY